MHQLTIHNLGPIQHCELPLKPYIVLTGFQASGKSTIAKAIHFFRTIKEDIFQLLLHNMAAGKGNVQSLQGDFESRVRSKFLNTFGSSYRMEPDMRLCYKFHDNVQISIFLKNSLDPLTPNFVWVEYSPAIREFLTAYVIPSDKAHLWEALCTLFDDPFETVYIPAGRSVLTVLGSQFTYFYSTMDDAQKRLLDACSRDYLERVMKLRPQFGNGLEGLLEGNSYTAAQKARLQEALSLIQQILKGKYTVADGDERIWVDGNRYVKINFASSGQQEIVWILNLFFYYLAQKRQVFFIVEEPASNLFPESQELVIELRTLVANDGNSILLTTHSPYVLGSINNLIYAGTVGANAPEQVEARISRFKWIDSSHCEARFVAKGGAESCMDPELMQIDNALLDQISNEINDTYDVLLSIEQETEGMI